MIPPWLLDVVSLDTPALGIVALASFAAVLGAVNGCVWAHDRLRRPTIKHPSTSALSRRDTPGDSDEPDQPLRP